MSALELVWLPAERKLVSRQFDFGPVVVLEVESVAGSYLASEVGPAPGRDPAVEVAGPADFVLDYAAGDGPVVPLRILNLED